MEEEKVKLTHQPIHLLNGLVDILLDKEYFSHIDNAKAYVTAIYDFIYTIPTLKLRRTKSLTLCNK